MKLRMLIAGLLVGVAAFAAEAGGDLFQKATTLVRAGNLEEAIKLYQHVATEFASDHALAAKALMAEAKCYETLGQDKATKLYEQVARDFPDQKDSVAAAKDRLVVLRQGKQAAAPTAMTPMSALWPSRATVTTVSPWARASLAARTTASRSRAGPTRQKRWSTARPTDGVRGVRRASGPVGVPRRRRNLPRSAPGPCAGRWSRLAARSSRQSERCSRAISARSPRSWCRRRQPRPAPRTIYVNASPLTSARRPTARRSCGPRGPNLRASRNALSGAPRLFWQPPGSPQPCRAA